MEKKQPKLKKMLSNIWAVFCMIFVFAFSIGVIICWVLFSFDFLEKLKNPTNLLLLVILLLAAGYGFSKHD